MQLQTRQWAIGGGIVLLLLLIGVLLLWRGHQAAPVPPTVPVPEAAAPAAKGPLVEAVGTSTEGRAITAYTYGTGATNLLFVGGMHGGYEWNSVLLAYQFMDYVAANPAFVPAGISVTVIPALNPDGVYKVTGKVGRFTALDVSTDPAVLAKGRFDANGVDLNRNFGCHWAATSTWQGRTVNAGTSAFSEPEAAALRSFVVAHKPHAVIFWHSQSNAVYASECDQGILPGTLAVMNAYAGAAKYPAVKTFDAYAITGDSEGWLASIGIPAVTVELSTHSSTEWTRNLAGVQALLKLYSN